MTGDLSAQRVFNYVAAKGTEEAVRTPTFA